MPHTRARARLLSPCDSVFHKSIFVPLTKCTISLQLCL